MLWFKIVLTVVLGLNALRELGLMLLGNILVLLYDLDKYKDLIDPEDLLLIEEVKEQKEALKKESGSLLTFAVNAFLILGIWTWL